MLGNKLGEIIQLVGRTLNCYSMQPACYLQGMLLLSPTVSTFEGLIHIQTDVAKCKMDLYE